VQSSSLAKEAIHRRCLELAESRHLQDAAIGEALLQAYHARIDRHYGFGTFAEYGDRLFGFSPRMTRERLRVAEALEELPRTAAALRSGALHWSAVREITRVATAETEAEWIAAATGKTVREIERLVAERREGQRPSDPGDPSARPRVRCLVLPPDVDALMDEAMGRVRAALGGAADEAEVIAEVMRRSLGVAEDDGRAPYQVLVTVCPDCGAARQQGCGGSVVISDEARDHALCDAQLVDGETGAASQEIPPATRRLVLRRDDHTCRVPGCRNALWVDLHHVVRRSDGGTHEASNLVTLCSVHHRAAHEGRLWISGTAGALTVCHPDGTPYGQFPSPGAVAVLTQAFATLSEIGWPEHAIRDVLAGVRPHVGRGTNVQALVSWCEEVLSGERAAPA
jgi:hypothetical protein